MEIRTLERKDVIILKRRDFEMEQEKQNGCFFAQYESFAQFDSSNIKESGYSKKIRTLEDNEVAIIARAVPIQKPWFTIDQLIDRILMFYKADRRVFNRNRRKNERIDLRVRQVIQTFMVLCSNNGLIERTPQMKIGELTGGFLHANVINSYRRITWEYENILSVRNELNDLMTFLNVEDFIPELRKNAYIYRVVCRRCSYRHDCPRLNEK